MKLQMVLEKKVERGHERLYDIPSTVTRRDVARRLCEKRIGALMVREGEGAAARYIGIVSERDVLRYSCSEEPLDAIKVTDAMTPNVVAATLDDAVEYVMKVMTRHHIRHIPVVDETARPSVVGLLSIRDLLHALIDEKEVVIQHLNDLTAGTYGNVVF